VPGSPTRQWLPLPYFPPTRACPSSSRPTRLRRGRVLLPVGPCLLHASRPRRQPPHSLAMSRPLRPSPILLSLSFSSSRRRPPPNPLPHGRLSAQRLQGNLPPLCRLRLIRLQALRTAGPHQNRSERCRLPLLPVTVASAHTFLTLLGCSASLTPPPTSSIRRTCRSSPSGTTRLHRHQMPPPPCQRCSDAFPFFGFQFCFKIFRKSSTLIK
jgi:hypothetical protein